MSGNKDIVQFIKDVKSFGISVAQHFPGIGQGLAIYDTYKKGKKLRKSTPKAMNAMKRKVKIKSRRRVGRATKKKARRVTKRRS